MSGLFHYPRLQDPSGVRPTTDARQRLAAAKARRDTLSDGVKLNSKRLEKVREFLELAPKAAAYFSTLIYPYSGIAVEHDGNFLFYRRLRYSNIHDKDLVANDAVF